MRFVLVIVWVLGMARVATGDPPIRKPVLAGSLDHLARATKLYNVRSFEDAANEYKAGALIEPAPVFDYNLGQCYRQLGRYKEAIWHYERFLKTSPETPERNASVTGFIAQMQAELESRAMTAPPIEPAPLATLPPNAAPVAPVEPWYRDRAGWIFAAGGAVALGGSALLFSSAGSLDDQANRTAMQGASQELHDRAHTRALFGTVAAVGGVMLLTTGVVKLVVTPTGVAAAGRF